MKGEQKVKGIPVRMLVGMFVFVMTCGDLWSQATAQISGTVKDQSGAVLPGVEVTGAQTETGITRSAVTNETGTYVLPNLAIGPYRLEAALPGFRTFVQTGIVLEVNASPVVNPVLQVGQVTDQVEVQANAALVETRNAGVGQVMENTRILELPLNGRNVEDLIVLGGAAAAANPAIGQVRNPFFGGAVSVGGGLATTLNYTLDGANHNTYQDNSYVILPFPDALEEFKVETSATGAQNGMKSAGSVDMVTKSGTNAFHGNLFEFVRNGMFNARNAFATKRDTIKRNQFGGTVGGPIARDRIFFFAGYQGTTIRMDPSDVLGFVPTPAMEAGDFTAFTSPACNVGRQITLKAPFVNNRVDPALFSKPAVALAKLLPSTADPCGRIIYGNPTFTNEHQVVGRLDYQRSAKNQLFARYLVDSIFSPPPYDVNKNLLSSGNNGADGLAQAFTLGDTYLLSAGTVNAFRLTGNRVAGGRTGPSVPPGAGLVDIGVKMFSYDPHNPDVTVNNAFALGVPAGPTRNAVFAAADDLSVIRGNHQLAFGTNAALWWLNSYGNTYNHGSMTFNGQTTGLALADYFTGNASVFQMGTNGDQHKRSKYIALYAADIWKVSRKLTLNYGLRWEPYFPMLNLDGGAMHFDLDALRKGIKTTVYNNLPPGVFFNGDPGFPGLAMMNNHWWDFSPRVGLAWDVAGDGLTSVRASLGTFYDFPAARYMLGPSNAPPANPIVISNNVNFADPWAGYPGGDPFPRPYGRSLTRDTATWPLYGVVNAFDYDSPTMKVAQWNLSVQKQIGTDWLVSATYLGNGTTHLWTAQNINPPVFLGLGPCTLNGISYPTCSSTANTNQRRRFSLENPQTGQYFGAVIHTDTGGTASYNGVIVSVQRRASRGVTINANYTWSHCISDPWGTSDAGSKLNFQGYTNPDNRRFDRGNCTIGTIDQRHLFNLSAVAETPRFSNSTLRTVGSGWRFSTIFRILSGDYLSVTTGQDRALNNTYGQRVNQILGSPYGDRSVKSYFNPAAFTLPALGTLGNSGIGNIAGPGTWQLDTALTRTFQLHEAQKLEFRAEAFNLTNAFHMLDPVTNFDSNTFGQVTSAKDPRIMQFALKYLF
jgi:hypothetical protein